MIKIERFTLRKPGFTDVNIRKYWMNNENYVWEIMSTSSFGWSDSKWTPLPFSEDIILNNIKEYGV